MGHKLDSETCTRMIYNVLEEKISVHLKTHEELLYHLEVILLALSNSLESLCTRSHVAIGKWFRQRWSRIDMKISMAINEEP